MSGTRHEIEVALTPTGGPETVRLFGLVNASLHETAGAATTVAAATVGVDRAIESTNLRGFAGAAANAAGQLKPIAPAATRAAEGVWLLEAATTQETAAGKVLNGTLQGSAESMNTIPPAAAAAAEGIETLAAESSRAGNQVEALLTDMNALVKDGFDRVVSGSGRARKALKDVVPPELAAELKVIEARLKDLHEQHDAGGRIQGVGNSMTMGITVPVMAAAGAATAMQLSFENSLTQLETLVGISSEQVREWRGELMEMAPAVGQFAAPLTDGMLAITGAGVRGAEAMELLEYSAKGASMGLGEVNDVARLGTAAAQAYAEQQLGGKRALEIIFATAREGNFEVSQLAGSMGRVLPIAAQLGVEFEDVGAFIASFTKVNGDASQSVTGLVAFLQALIAPTKEGAETLAKVGLSAAKLREEVKDKGLTQALIDLIALFKNSPEELVKVIPSIEGLVGALGTAGLQSADFTLVADNIHKSANVIDDAWAIVEDRDGHKLKTATIELSNLGITIGAELAPALVDLVRAGVPVIHFVGDVVEGFGLLPGPIKTTAFVIGGVVVAMGPFITVLGTGVQLLTSVRIAAATASAANALGGMPVLLSGTAAAGVAAGAGAETAAAGITAANAAARGLAITLGVGAAVLVGLGLLAAAFGNAASKAREMGETGEESVRKVQAALTQMDVATLQGEEAAVRGSLERVRQDLARERAAYRGLSDKPVVVAVRRVGTGERETLVNEYGPSEQDQAEQRLQVLALQQVQLEQRRAQIAAEIASQRAAAAQAAEARRLADATARRGAQLLGVEDPDDEKKKRTPIQLGLPGTRFSDIPQMGVGSAAALALQPLDAEVNTAFAAVQGHFADLSTRSAELTVELAVAGETLDRLPRGSEAFKDTNERVHDLRIELQSVNTELAAVLAGMQQLGRQEGISVDAKGLLPMMPFTPDPAALQAITDHGLRQLQAFATQPGRRDSYGRLVNGRGTLADVVARDQQTTTSSMRKRDVEMAARAGIQWGDLSEAQRATAGKEKDYAALFRKFHEGADEMDRAAAVAVGAMGDVALAWIEGSADIEQAVISSLTTIAQGLPGMDPFTGALIGTLGKVIGGLFASRERDREDDRVQRVRLEEYSDRALQQQKRREGPDRVTLQMIDSRTGRTTSETEYFLRRRAQRDAVERLPPATTP